MGVRHLCEMHSKKGAWYRGIDVSHDLKARAVSYIENQMEAFRMKKLILVTSVMALVFSFAALTTAGKGADKKGCTRIQDGILVDSSGDVIAVGFDGWGYNYQAHLFNGFYCDAYRDADWCQPYADISLVIKWKEAWLSNKECDGDVLLDRHLGFGS